MVKKVLITLSVLSILIVLNISHSQENPRLIPQEQWTEETRLWSIRAVIKEVGLPTPSRAISDKEAWVDTKKREYTAVLYVLQRRWLRYNKHYPNFQDMVRAYCTGLDKPVTLRHRWVHDFVLSAEKPKIWPKNEGSWQDGMQAVKTVIAPTVDAWAAGQLEDPYHGKAWHWGSHEDPRLKWQLKPIPGFKNIYYKDQ